MERESQAIYIQKQSHERESRAAIRAEVVSLEADFARSEQEERALEERLHAIRTIKQATKDRLEHLKNELADEEQLVSD
jgi:hypothetical protein